MRKILLAVVLLWICAVNQALALPDLEYMSLGIWNNQTNVQQQQSFYVDIKWRVLNQAFTNNFREGVYLSTDQTLNTSSDYLVFSRACYGATLGTNVGWQSCSVGTTIPAGIYYVIGKVDDLNQITESSEANNIAIAPTRITVSALKPDLIITAMAPGTTLPITVRSFTPTVTGKNIGPGSASEPIWVMLSTDNNITVDDIYLGSNTGSTLTNGQSRTLDVPCTLPTYITNGTFYIGAIIDPNNSIVETNESNNTFVYGQVTISNPIPVADLNIEARNLVDHARVGENLSLDVDLLNKGEATASNFHVGWYLGNNLGDKQVLVQELGTFTVAPGKTNTSHQTYTVKSADVGYTYLTVVADNRDEVPEKDIWGNDWPARVFLSNAIPHNVSTPDPPTGASSGATGQSYLFYSGGATCNLGHAVEYRFAWGDSTTSSWSSATSASHTWTNGAAFNVTCQGRCSVDNSVISQWSSAHQITIDSNNVYAAYLGAGERGVLSKPILFGGIDYRVVGITAASVQNFCDLFMPASYSQPPIDVNDPYLGSKASTISLLGFNPSFLVICNSNGTWSVCNDATARMWIYHLAMAQVQAEFRNNVALTKGVYSFDPSHYYNALHFRDWEALWFPTCWTLYGPVIGNVPQQQYRQAAFEQPLQRYVTHGVLNLYTSGLVPLDDKTDFTEFAEKVTDGTINRAHEMAALKRRWQYLPPSLAKAGTAIHAISDSWNIYENVEEMVVLHGLEADTLVLMNYLHDHSNGVSLDPDFDQAWQGYLSNSGDLVSQQLDRIRDTTINYVENKVADKMVEKATAWLIEESLKNSWTAAHEVTINGVTLSASQVLGIELILASLTIDFVANPEGVYEQQIVSHYAAKNAQNWEKIGNKIAQDICNETEIDEIQADSYLMLEVMEREIYGDISQDFVAATDASYAGNAAAGWASLLSPDQWRWIRGTAIVWDYAQQHWNDVLRDMVDRTRGSPLPAQEISAPTVTITSPTTAAVYSTANSSIVLSGTAADDVGVVKVTWQNEATSQGMCSGSNSWTSTSISLVPGTNKMTIAAWDASGKSGTDTVAVVYNRPDTLSPTITISYPTSNSAYQSGSATIDISGIASDDGVIASADWSSSRGGSGACSLSGMSVYATGILLYVGQNTITITVHDATGKTGSDTLTVTYTVVDTQNPVVEITYPTSSGVFTTTATNLDIGGIASDDRYVSSVSWSNNRGGSGLCNGTVSWSAFGIQIFSGTNVISVMATDGSSKTGSDALTVNCVPLVACGSVRCEIAPQAAVLAGAQWRIDGGRWQNSGTTLDGLPSGIHNLQYSTVGGWSTPGEELITINTGQTNTINATYVFASAFRITAIEKADDCVRIGFTSASGKYYCLERTTSLNGTWTRVADNIPGNDGIRQATDLMGMNTLSAFYRIRLNQTPNPALVDTDGDGMPDSWTQAYFGHSMGLQSDNSSAGDDADADGMNNLQECLAGTDPTNSASVFRILSVARQENDVRVAWRAVGGRTNFVQASPFPVGGFSDISPMTVISGTVETTTNYLDVGAAKNWTARFYRIRHVAP